MSRAQLADEAGISRQYVRSLELGEYDPTLGTLQKIAKAFGVKIEDLVKQ